MAVISIGDVFPDLAFETYSGSSLTVSEAVARKPKTVFWVNRFIGCRTCQYDMDSLAEEYAAFTQRDAQVFVVIQSKRESIISQKGEWSVPFDIICDPKRQIYRALDVHPTATKEDRIPKTKEGLERLAQKQQAVKNGNYVSGPVEGEAQQLPALFIVGSDSKVLYAHYAVDSVDIPNVGELLQLLDNL